MTMRRSTASHDIQNSTKQWRSNIKVPPEGWLECARTALIEEGIAGVKIDRLARRLKVTRGGFYYHFNNLSALLDELLEHWRRSNCFITDDLDLSTPEAAQQALRDTADDLIHERHFDPTFDMAVREWGRTSKAVGSVVAATDEIRMRELRSVFQAMGYDIRAARVRAKIFYMHQIGYYCIDLPESVAEREENMDTYLEALGGEMYERPAVAA